MQTLDIGLGTLGLLFEKVLRLTTSEEISIGGNEQ